MIAIKRTAYPRLNPSRNISERSLYDGYTLSQQELFHIKMIAATTVHHVKRVILVFHY